MAYLELSKEAYDNLIRAAANKAGSVAKVCNEQGIWSPEAASEAPPDAVQEDITVRREEEPTTRSGFSTYTREGNSD